MSDEEKEGYIVEFVTIGKSVKVTAFDPESLKEVSIVGTTKASKRYLTRLAIRKLEYMMKKEKKDT